MGTVNQGAPTQFPSVLGVAKWRCPEPVSRGTAAPNKEVNMEFMGEYISDLPAPQGYVFLGMLEPDEKKEDPSDENDDE